MKNLIIYYSRRGQNYVNGSICNLDKGNAELIAGYISEAVKTDVFEVVPVNEYPADYMQCTVQAQEELKINARPALKEYITDISEYDNIFICGPCWWGTYPMPIFSQLEKLDFSNKYVFPVMTHEGSGAGSCERDLKKICKNAKIAKCLAVQGAAVPRSKQQVTDWVRQCVS